MLKKEKRILRIGVLACGPISQPGFTGPLILHSLEADVVSAAGYLRLQLESIRDLPGPRFSGPRTSLFFGGKPLTITVVEAGTHETNDHLAAP
jgi:hypothetical protein